MLSRAAMTWPRRRTPNSSFSTTRCKASVCARSDGLPPAPGTADPTSILALHGTKVANNLIIDVGDSEQKKSLSDPESGKRKELAKTRRFEALSVSMDTLIFNFLADETQDYVTYLDGFKFNQVRDGALDCE